MTKFVNGHNPTMERSTTVRLPFLFLVLICVFVYTIFWEDQLSQRHVALVYDSDISAVLNFELVGLNLVTWLIS